MNILLNLPPFSRVISTLQQIEQATQVNNTFALGLLRQLTGIQSATLDLNAEEKKRVTALRTALEDKLTKAGVLAKYTRVFIPKSQ